LPSTSDSTRRWWVASAAAVMATTGSITQPLVKWSEIATAEYPRSSMRHSSARHADTGWVRRGIAALNRNGCGTVDPSRSQ
jgi:hypothetical protein